MHNSKSEFSIRRSTFGKKTEILCTINEENSRLIFNDEPTSSTSTPKKSATFHEFYDLKKCKENSAQNRSNIILATAPQEYKEKIKRLNSQPTTLTRKRSIFYEMGERIRLFSTASFVSPAIVMPTSSSTSSSDGTAPPTVAVMVNDVEENGTLTNNISKSHSLNSFDDSTEPVFVSARCPSSRRNHRMIMNENLSPPTSNPPPPPPPSPPPPFSSITSCGNNQKSRIPAVGSLLSLQSHTGMEIDDLEKGLEKDMSQLGILCHHCSTNDLTCPKSQKELPSPTSSSVYSLARSDLSNEPLCRICHCCWPPDSNDPLISPCRCSGSLQYVHVSCLMHWLDISARKLHRPAICELCLYKYRRRRVLKYREMKLPHCAQTDIRYYTLFVAAILMMIFSAFATVICFQLEKSYGLQGNRSLAPLNVESIAEVVGISTVSDETTIPSGIGIRKRIGDASLSIPKEDYVRREDTENILSTVTLIAAMIFFLNFFLAMYAHVKSGLSFCGYVTLCWSSNLEWSIEEYKHSRDTQYFNKLEELRRKINEKQKKAADEVEPLRSSVIVLE